MSDQEQLSPEEVSRRITVGMGMVYDLFGQLVPFLRTLRAGLEASDLEMDPIVPKLGRLPLGPKRDRSVANNFVTTDLGFLMEVGVSSAEQDEADEDEEEGDGPSDTQTRQITPDSQFVAVRIHLYDPASDGNFVPQVIAAVLSDIVRHPSRKSGDGRQPIRNPKVPRRGLFNLVKQLNAGVRANQTIEARAAGGKLQAAVSAVTARPLAHFDSEASVDAFVDELVAMAGGGGD